MEEKVAIEQAAAEGFLSLYNKETRSSFKITHIADAPDIRCQDDQGKPLNLEITLTEDRPGDIHGENEGQVLQSNISRCVAGRRFHNPPLLFFTKPSIDLGRDGYASEFAVD